MAKDKDKKRDKKRRERIKKLKGICDSINGGDFGGDNKDAVLFFGDEDIESGIEWLPTGAKTLDWALGGGWPMGRVCAVYGPESGGKSTLCLHAIAEFQKKYTEDEVAIVDTEFSFDVDYAKNLGVDVELLMIHQPESGNQAMNVIDELIDKGTRLIIVDSVAAMTTEAELEGDYGAAHVATQARLMSQSLKRLVGKVNRSKSLILFTNQVREKIGVKWGKKTTEPGGRALKFYSSCRVEIVAIGKDKEGEEVVSNRIKATVTKNKVAPPFRVAQFVITFGHGIDQIAAILDDAINKKIVVKKGAWFSLGKGGKPLGQGRGKVLDLMRADENILKEIVEKAAATEAPKEKTEETDSEQPEKKARKLPTVPFDDESNDDEGEVTVEPVE